jgi:hypothetical protein
LHPTAMTRNFSQLQQQIEGTLAKAISPRV